MKFEDVKKLPPDLQPLVIEFGRMQSQLERLAEDVGIMRALVQHFIGMLTSDLDGGPPPDAPPNPDLTTTPDTKEEAAPND